ncbi:MAG: ribosome maturation factor RimP [Wolinella sp.]
MIDSMLNEKIEKLVASFGCNLYDLVLVRENDRQILRLYITKDGGVNLDDCAAVSEMVSPLLDVDEPLGSEYFFEVSSPGIERALKKPSHFRHAIGELVRIKLNDKREVEGKLISADDGCISIEGELNSIAYTEIKKAHTFYIW